jgi:hypothetical protein
MTAFEKVLPKDTNVLPKDNSIILNEMNVNTAFTTSCPKVFQDSEIVIFRKEEWFKVFIHETFHNFGLDFSDMNNAAVSKYILSLYRVQSDVNLYECYTEFWAEIINALFSSFFLLLDKDKGDKQNNVIKFLSLSYYLINQERVNSFIQMIKVLNYMGLDYSDFLSTKQDSIVLLYREKSNILAYYIIKTVLLNNYPGFLAWCKKNNKYVIQFKKTQENQLKFCDYIRDNYKSKRLLQNIQIVEEYISTWKKKLTPFIKTNLRMSVTELC